jgi:hypothetical protein
MIDKFLELLNLSALTHVEAGQLMRRHLSDLANLDPSSLTDELFNSMLEELRNDDVLYVKALAQVRKNDETVNVELADMVRDKSLNAFDAGLKFYALSDDQTEVDASRVLRNVFDSYKNLTRLSYEAETLNIDKLVSELTGPIYSPRINLLQLDRTVARISNDNEAFKNLFGGRMVTTGLTETFDLKSIRKEMQHKYSDFANYVLIMAKRINTPLYNTTLNLLNTARKYYADQLARHAATVTKKDKPAV